MKTIPIAVQTELSKSTARIATCIRIVRRDGAIYTFTTNRKTLTINGETYLPAASFNPSDVKSGSNLDSDDVEVSGLLTSDTITEDDLRAGRWDYASFELFRVNWASPSDGMVKDRAGHFGKVTVSEQTFIVEMLGLIEAYNTSIGKITQPGCRTSLGTTECGVTPTTVTGTITTCDTDFFTLHDAARTEADGYFDEGIIEFLDGSASGLRYEIKAYIVGIMVTKTSIAYDVTGASYSLTEGCPRTWTACTTRFDNATNYRGEPWLRGNDKLIQVGRHSE